MILSRYNFCLLLEYLIFKVEAQFPFCVSPFVSLSCFMLIVATTSPSARARTRQRRSMLYSSLSVRFTFFRWSGLWLGAPTFCLPAFDSFELEPCKLSISHLQKYNTIHINLQVQVIKVHDDVSPLVHAEEGWKNFLTTLLQLCGSIVWDYFARLCLPSGTRKGGWNNIVTTLGQGCLRQLCETMCPLWCRVKLVPGIGSSLRLPQVTSADIASFSFFFGFLTM